VEVRNREMALSKVPLRYSSSLYLYWCLYLYLYDWCLFTYTYCNIILLTDKYIYIYVYTIYIYIYTYILYILCVGASVCVYRERESVVSWVPAVGFPERARSKTLGQIIRSSFVVISHDLPSERKRDWVRERERERERD
jgi:hypothetical protein